MRTVFAVVAGCLAVSSGIFAQTPMITSVQNPASNMPAALPNGGIAQGAIFVVYGSNLGPSAIIQPAGLPLPSTAGLGGTVITVIVNGTTLTAPMVYSLNSQVAGVLPSNIPIGTGSLTVAYNGVPSSPFPLNVVQSNFGISTFLDGSNTAVVTTPIVSGLGYQVITKTNPAIPGSTYTIWGTGLGAANSDNNTPSPADLGTPVEVWIGGLPTSVTYAGRSFDPGLDQINFTIPAGVGMGCEVSLAVQTGTMLSNYTTIPIALNGSPCFDAIGIPTATWLPLLAKNGADVGAFDLNQSTSTVFQGNTPSTTIAVKAKATFMNFTQVQLTPQVQAIFNPAVSPGGCVVRISQSANTGNFAYTGLNAGSAVTFTPSTGSALNLAAQSAGVYQVATATPVSAGIDTVGNGAGGANVGSFSTTLIVGPFDTWTNQNSLANTTVNRANPLTIQWTGGGASSSSYIDIQGSAGFGNNGTVTFECTALVASGQFAIPSAVLLALPSGPGHLQVGAQSESIVSVSGMDLSVASSETSSGVSVTWQ